MKKTPYLTVGFLFLLGVSFFLGSWNSKRGTGENEPPAGRRVLHYVDPMNPAHTSAKPGPAPCGMPMEPVYAEEGAPNSQNPEAPRHPGTVSISPQKQQIIGVRVDTVERKSFASAVRTSGVVALDESRIYRVSSSGGGWVREIFAGTTGSRVQKDEPLFAFYSPTFLTAQQAYFYILNTLDSMRQHRFEEIEQNNFTNVQLRTSTDNLRNLGVSEKQLKELAANRQHVRNIIVTAPAAGFVIARNLTLEQKFEPGAELYRIADLNSVWIQADLYKHERRYIRPGQAARIYSPDLGQGFEATVSEILPQFDASSRTLKVRLEAANPEFLLRPDMYVDVEFPVEVPPAISVPMDAVLDAGTRKTIFVETGNGYFEPREVKTGWRFGDRIEIAEGLSEGDRIVTSGNFLIDSESRMRLAAAGFYGEVAKDPVCRMHVDSEKAAVAGLKRTFGGKPYYFCSEECRVEFDREPERFAEKQAGKDHHDGEALAAERLKDAAHELLPSRQDPDAKTAAVPEGKTASKSAPDPVCGMPTIKSKAALKGLSSLYDGKTYYFCSKECKIHFDRNPTDFPMRRAAERTHGMVADEVRRP